MKPRTTILIVILSTVVIFALVERDLPPGLAETKEHSLNLKDHPPPPLLHSAFAQRGQLDDGVGYKPEKSDNGLPQKPLMKLAPTVEELRIMLETPVKFYGQVLDQSDEPVVGARIRCSWPYMGPKDIAREIHSSNPHGKFEITDMKSYALGISVYPPAGYDEQVSDRKDIQIAKAPDRTLQDKDYINLHPSTRRRWR